MTTQHQRQNQKILLIIPPSKAALNFVTYQQPINLAYLAAAAIKEGFTAEIWDYSINEFSENTFIKNIEGSNPAAIAYIAKLSISPLEIIFRNRQETFSSYPDHRWRSSLYRFAR